jgi:hypothetical protein
MSDGRMPFSPGRCRSKRGGPFLRNALCGPKIEPRPSSLTSRLNESLWTLLIASLTAFVGYAIIIIASRIERQRKERHAERFGDTNLKRQAASPVTSAPLAPD